MMRTAISLVAAAVGIYLVERYAIKVDEGDSGFIPLSQGFGVDEFAKAGAALGGIYLVTRFVK